MSAQLEVSLYCGLCAAKHEQKIPMPDGWDSRYQSVSDEHAWCPAHAKIADFADSQCPGCVGGWGDCDLWKSFAFSEMKLTASDLITMEAGICPKRTNGTLMFSRETGMQGVDLRGTPSVEGGKALAQAIREYAEKYKESA
jgi:hypothetical protein